jgi:phosphate transport system protein
MINNQIILLQRTAAGYVSGTEEMLKKCMDGIFSRNNALLEEVITKDEELSDQTDTFLDEACINTIAKFQPVAANLRTIIGIIKMSDALERIGDHCVNMAISGLILNAEPQIKPFVDLPKMTQAVVQMLKEASQALVGHDAQLAKKVLKDDDIVDDFKRKITEELKSFLETNCSSKSVTCIIELIHIAANLERIADMSTNICEDVVYIESGEVLKHNKY